MSAWVYVVFVLVGIFGSPMSRARSVAWIAWAIVTLALLAAIVVGEKGWP